MKAIDGMKFPGKTIEIDECSLSENCKKTSFILIKM